MPAPVLFVLHQEHSTPGRVAHILKNRGFSFDIRRPRLGDPLPDTLDNHSGAIVFGGPNSANDEEEFMRREIDWLKVPLREEKPYLGICLGAQILARHLGASVYCHRDGQVEIGYYPLRVTGAARELCADWPDHVYQWHREGFDLPRGAQLLAEGDAFPVQAFRWGPCAYAVQFHPEVTHAMMCRWTTRGAARMELPGAQQRPTHFEGRALYDLAIRNWLEAFIDQWVGPGQPLRAAAE